MEIRGALRCSLLILSALVLLPLQSCAAKPPIVQIRTVEVPVPVVVALSPDLLRDCEPRYQYPASSLNVGAIVDRLDSAEVALAICRNQIALIREAQKLKPP